MYYRKMAAYIGNAKLLINCFQDSLTGPTTQWYIQLDNAYIHVWKDLADAFLKQYKHNIDMTPDRLDLQRMKKKSESFKEYAHDGETRPRGLTTIIGQINDIYVYEYFTSSIL